MCWEVLFHFHFSDCKHEWYSSEHIECEKGTCECRSKGIDRGIAPPMPVPGKCYRCRKVAGNDSYQRWEKSLLDEGIVPLLLFTDLLRNFYEPEEGKVWEKLDNGEVSSIISQQRLVQNRIC